MDVVHGNVLVVEDDPQAGTLIVDILTKAGYGVRLVESRDVAVTAMRRYLYDVAIIDLRMPGMTLEDFQRAISTERQPASILLTAENVVESEARRYGFKHWIGKPFTPEQLIQLLRDVSRRRKTGANPLPGRNPY